ncbi:MAG TPA: alpha/beta hydrolase [Candidatus Binatia bacterium]|nr:alpha/beta hydrolase [Candidatus Binatia bacterium]
MSQPRDSFIEVRGLTLHYLEWGKPGGEPLVLVHGFLDQAHSWQPFVRALQNRIPQPLWVVAPDCRGHGDSGWVGAGGYYHFPDYVFDLDCLIRALGVDRFKLIGHSMGGTISFLYSGTFPKKVQQLVLIEGVGAAGMNFSDAPPRMEKWITEMHARGRNHFRQYRSVAAGAKQLQQTNPRLSNELALELARSGMKQDAVGRWVWKFDPLHRTVSPQPFYSAQAMEFFGRIQCPVLIVDGKQSRHSQRPDKQQRLAVVQDKQFAEIDDAGHWVHLDNPEALALVVAEFLF